MHKLQIILLSNKNIMMHESENNISNWTGTKLATVHCSFFLSLLLFIGTKLATVHWHKTSHCSLQTSNLKSLKMLCILHFPSLMVYCVPSPSLPPAAFIYLQLLPWESSLTSLAHPCSSTFPSTSVLLSLGMHLWTFWA